jgi:hypothetical protein
VTPHSIYTYTAFKITKLSGLNQATGGLKQATGGWPFLRRIAALTIALPAALKVSSSVGRYHHHPEYHKRSIAAIDVELSPRQIALLILSDLILGHRSLEASTFFLSALAGEASPVIEFRKILSGSAVTSATHGAVIHLIPLYDVADATPNHPSVRLFPKAHQRATALPDCKRAN